MDSGVSSSPSEPLATRQRDQDPEQVLRHDIYAMFRLDILRFGCNSTDEGHYRRRLGLKIAANRSGGCQRPPRAEPSGWAVRSIDLGVIGKRLTLGRFDS